MKLIVLDHDASGAQLEAGNVEISEPNNVILQLQGKTYDLGWLLEQAAKYSE